MFRVELNDIQRRDEFDWDAIGDEKFKTNHQLRKSRALVAIQGPQS